MGFFLETLFGGLMVGMLYSLIAIGFVTSFVAGWFVVRSLLDYVSQHGFAVFAWWRIIVGAIGLIGLALLG